MTHFAEIDNNGIVLKVIINEQSFIDTLPNKNDWVQILYNPYPRINDINEVTIRRSYIGNGYTYDAVMAIFTQLKSYNFWILHEDGLYYESPIKKLMNGQIYQWNEDNSMWESGA